MDMTKQEAEKLIMTSKVMHKEIGICEVKGVYTDFGVSISPLTEKGISIIKKWTGNYNIYEYMESNYENISYIQGQEEVKIIYVEDYNNGLHECPVCKSKADMFSAWANETGQFVVILTCNVCKTDFTRNLTQMGSYFYKRPRKHTLI